MLHVRRGQCLRILTRTTEITQYFSMRIMLDWLCIFIYALEWSLSKIITILTKSVGKVFDIFDHITNGLRNLQEVGSLTFKDNTNWHAIRSTVWDCTEFFGYKLLACVWLCNFVSLLHNRKKIPCRVTIVNLQ